jgi:hypothetical protein
VTAQNYGFLLASQASLDVGSVGVDISLWAASNPQWVNASTTTTVNSNAYVNLGASMGMVSTLTVGDASFNSSSVVFYQSSGASVGMWTNNAAAARVDNSGSLQVSSLVTGGSFFSVSHSSAQSSVAFANIDFSARAMATRNSTVHVGGGKAMVNGTGFKGSGYVQFTGGVSVSGKVPQAVTVMISPQGSSAALAAVDTAQTFNASGNIAGNGHLVVNGNVYLDTTTTQVDPKVWVKSGGQVAINSATSFHAKAVDIAQGATFRLQAQAQAAGAQGNVMFDQISTYAGSIVVIELGTDFSSFVKANMAASASAVVAFNYSSSMNTVSQLQQTTVQVVDSTGAMITLSANASMMGRRLLASSGTATWGNSGMSYQVTGSGGSSGVSVASCVWAFIAVGVSFFM